MVDPSHTFHIADYAVFGLTILISIGIGIYYALSGGRQRTTSEYLLLSIIMLVPLIHPLQITSAYEEAGPFQDGA
nr:hypothetical protein BaRGS_030032 [Batillaria attramentaria]